MSVCEYSFGDVGRCVGGVTLNAVTRVDCGHACDVGNNWRTLIVVFISEAGTRQEQVFVYDEIAEPGWSPVWWRRDRVPSQEIIMINNSGLREEITAFVMSLQQGDTTVGEKFDETRWEARTTVRWTTMGRHHRRPSRPLAPSIRGHPVIFSVFFVPFLAWAASSSSSPPLRTALCIAGRWSDVVEDFLVNLAFPLDADML